MRSYELEQAYSISELAYLYKAYKLELACTISKLAYLYKAPRIRTGLYYLWDDLSIIRSYELEQACSNSKKTLKLVLVYKIHKI